MSAQRSVNPHGAGGKKPKLGQNFLADQQAARKIVEALGDISRRTVIEVGPGKGAITGLLAARAQRLIAIELDRQLAAALSMNYLTRKHVEVIQADVLTVDLETLVRGALHSISDFTQSASPTADVVGNLPYYITSDILLHLFRHHRNIGTILVMVQREVAERLAAQPGSRDYGVLTVTAQLYARVELLFTLPPEAFAPPPKVHSAVVRLKIAPRFAGLNVVPETFMKFVKLAFAQKRKTLANNLKGQYSTAAIRTALGSAQAAARAEALSLEQLAVIFKALA
jgi:16S rRNA (adenine1518-N6/adenine1519-N6)-dimethyltransferase